MFASASLFEVCTSKICRAGQPVAAFARQNLDVWRANPRFPAVVRNLQVTVITPTDQLKTALLALPAPQPSYPSPRLVNPGHRGAEAFLIFGGTNPRAIVAFCRELERLGRRFSIISRGVDDTLQKTRFKSHIHATRQVDELNWTDVSRAIIQARAHSGAGSYCICPSSEALNRFLLDHRTALTGLGCTLPLVDTQTYRRISNKYSFHSICESRGLIVPHLYGSVDNIEFPCVAKPYRNLVGGRILYPVILRSDAELQQFLLRHNTREYFYQAYVPGPSHYLLFYIRRDGSDVRFSQENLLQQAEGKSIILARSANLHQAPIAESYKSVLLGLEFHGLIMIELKGSGGQFTMIEANPRLWGPLQLSMDGGSNLVRAFIQDQLGAPVTGMGATDIRSARYFWLGGALQNLLAHHTLQKHPANRRLRFADIARGVCSDIYLRPDTARLFLHEIIHAFTMRRRGEI